jgi:hypothetical protein
MRKFRAPTRVLAIAASLLVVAASVLAVAASAQSGSQANHPTRPLHVTKECSQYTGQIGSYCTITSSNVAAITVGTKVFYAQAAGPSSLDSDVILYAGPGNTAAGHCVLDFATGRGLCTFSDGTGTLEGFTARANVSYLGGPDWAWNGTYRFREHGDK